MATENHSPLFETGLDAGKVALSGVGATYLSEGAFMETIKNVTTSVSDIISNTYTDIVSGFSVAEIPQIGVLNVPYAGILAPFAAGGIGVAAGINSWKKNFDNNKKNYLGAGYGALEQGAIWSGVSGVTLASLGVMTGTIPTAMLTVGLGSYAVRNIPKVINGAISLIGSTAKYGVQSWKNLTTKKATS